MGVLIGAKILRLLEWGNTFRLFFQVTQVKLVKPKEQSIPGDSESACNTSVIPNLYHQHEKSFPSYPSYPFFGKDGWTTYCICLISSYIASRFPHLSQFLGKMGKLSL